MEYMISLTASIDIARLLLTLGLPFRDHDESESSKRKGNFEHKIEELGCQLENFVENIRDDSRFCNLKGLADLCKKLVEKKKHTSYHLVFLLLKLVLILPVATASVERVFSAMKYIKSDLRNRIALTPQGLSPGSATGCS
ncbi:uncharacterized protein [Oryza sativa Japonica Group]|uniref:uncharacterized protein n=1 Tax=Oryza sativa subsp. japonica TaxID=39947 RepID=UPI000E1BADCB|nr:uncharacterized protein LOC107279678 [Oryza sativa Japonica Group]